MDPFGLLVCVDQFFAGSHARTTFQNSSVPGVGPVTVTTCGVPVPMNGSVYWVPPWDTSTSYAWFRVPVTLKVRALVALKYGGSLTVIESSNCIPPTALRVSVVYTTVAKADPKTAVASRATRAIPCMVDGLFMSRELIGL